MEKKFYVLRTISGKENKVKEYLETKIKNDQLQAYFSRVILPTVKVIQSYKGKKVKRERPFFPGYVVIEAVLVGEIVSVIKSTNFVVGFLGGRKPVPLRQKEVDSILNKMDESQECSEECEINYAVGETIKVIFGPFTGFYGEIEEVCPYKKKLKITVKIFGRKTPLELGYLQVERG